MHMDTVAMLHLKYLITNHGLQCIVHCFEKLHLKISFYDGICIVKMVGLKNLHNEINYLENKVCICL